MQAKLGSSASLSKDGVGELGRKSACIKPRFGFSAEEIDPLACVHGSTDQLAGYCNKIGANYSRSRRSVVGNIPGCSFFGSKKRKKQPPWGPGLPAEMVSVGPMNPRPDSPPELLAATAGHHSSRVAPGLAVSRGPLRVDCSPGSATRTSLGSFLLLPSASWLTAAAAVHTRQSVDGQRGISQANHCAPPLSPNMRSCRDWFSCWSFAFFSQAGCSADRRYARRSHYCLPKARVMRRCDWLHCVTACRASGCPGG